MTSQEYEQKRKEQVRKQWERRRARWDKFKKSKEFPYPDTQITGIGTGRINPKWSKAWDEGRPW